MPSSFSTRVARRTWMLPEPWLKEISKACVHKLDAVSTCWNPFAFYNRPADFWMVLPRLWRLRPPSLAELPRYASPPPLGHGTPSFWDPHDLGVSSHGAALYSPVLIPKTLSKPSCSSSNTLEAAGGTERWWAFPHVTKRLKATPQRLWMPQPWNNKSYDQHRLTLQYQSRLRVRKCGKSTPCWHDMMRLLLTGLSAS